MQTKREWLAERGLAIAGARGKFSRAANEALVKAIAEGVQFADTAKPVKPAKPVIKATGEAQPAPVVKSETTTRYTDYLFPSDFRFPEGEYKAIEVGGKREFSMRECCNTCRVSLTNHMCDNPTIHGDVTVRIVKR